MSSSVLEYLSFIQSRPNRKARQRRVIESLDERLPGWEKIFDDRDFHDWLQIFPSNGARSRADWLIDLWDAFDESNLVTLVRLFVEEHAGLRPRKGVPLEGTPYRVGDYINSRYVVIDCLGRGGFGNVLLVYHDDRHFHEFLALKVLRDDVARERFASSRFDREANVLLALQSHPNIVGVRYVDKISGQLLILSEYIESDINGCVSLGDHIKRSGISLAKQMQWLVECCSGLSFAYKQGIVAHRDIKPENILIDRHGHARVADFGLASVSIARDNDESSGLLASSNKPAFATQQGRSLAGCGNTQRAQLRC
ncbi:MAG: hypothetical protein E6Q94_02590 [Burkholderiaceae bacterium]|nr:MAG: hypothetical protein E6Q94_02590 [Burkholderiaceae bacterium]